MSFRDDLVKDHLNQIDKEKQAEAPPQYVLVLHLNPSAYDLSLHLCVQHVLEDHLSVSSVETEAAIRRAANCGMAVIRPVTKDVGESLMQKAGGCLVMILNRDFKVALELL